MSSDAKLGLVVGLGLVLTIALVFYRRPPSPSDAAAMSTSARVPTHAPAPFVPTAAPPPLPAD